MVTKIKEKVMQWLDWSLDHAGVVLGIVGVITLVALWGIYLLPTSTSRDSLMPKDHPVYQKYQVFLDTVGSASDLIVVIEGDEPKKLRQYATTLAAELKNVPEVATASERIDVNFLLQNAFLLLPEEQLNDLLKKVNDLPEFDASKYDFSSAMKQIVANVEGPSPELSADKIDMDSIGQLLAVPQFLLAEYDNFLKDPQKEDIAWNDLIEGMMAGYGMPGGGYYTSYDEDMYILFVRPRNPSQEADILGPFYHGVQNKANELTAQWSKESGKNIKATLTGLPAIGWEEHEAVTHDVAMVVIYAVIGILLLVLIWMRSIRRAIYIFIPMALGVIWNTGLTYVIIGELSIMTSGFTAILFGLGMDYGIFLNSRVMSEFSRNPNDVRGAIRQGFSDALGGVLTAGGAATLIFGSLMFSEFTGFADLGMVAALGVLTVLFATLVVQPVIMVILPPRYSKRIVAEHAKIKEENSKVEARGTHGILAKPWFSYLVVVVAFSLAGVGAFFGLQMPFDYDVLGMLPKNSQAAEYQRRLLKVSDYQSDVMVVISDTLDEANDAAQKLRKLDVVKKVQSPSDLLPPDSVKRAVIARQLGGKLDSIVGQVKEENITLNDENYAQLQKIIASLSSKIDDYNEMINDPKLAKEMDKLQDTLDTLQEKISVKSPEVVAASERFLNSIQKGGFTILKTVKAWEKAKDMTPLDLPPSLRDRFVSSEGKLVTYFYPNGSSYDADFLDKLIKEVNAVVPEATGFPSTHQVFSNMVASSFRVSAVAAILVAIFWMIFLFRNAKIVVIGALPLLIGGAWMVGIEAALGMSYNYTNIIALPLIIGLAIDYGVWFAHNYQDAAGRIDAWMIVKQCGMSILLAAGTTLIGLGAISMAEYQGIASMGYALVIGLFSCCLAALFVAPAFAAALEKIHEKK